MRFKIVVLFLFIFLAGVFAPVIFADAKSDYDYQYGLYRTNYSEFLLLKRDYLITPSLDNQQKALLSAKQSIQARDLAKASLNWYLLDLIGSYQVSYPPIAPIITSLAASRQYFLDQAQLSQRIVTEDDLNNFTEKYLETVPENDAYIKYGIMAQKIAALVRIQIDSITALQNIEPKLPSPLPSGLALRIQELKVSAKAIDTKIDTLINILNLPEAVGETSTDIFFSGRVEKLVEIRSLQLDWINRLIDIDINYVQPQI